ncbi:MAG TPA: COQ9 family protein [Alphaproteobacteria bacterium]|nr:COQ9 family protein [Alphaproteobacteria bacterium]
MSAETPSFDHEQAREAIIAAALPNVPFDGWTLETLRRAAADAGYDPLTALRVFPRGPIEAIEAWVTQADRRMLEALERQDGPGLKVRERVAAAIRLRLQDLGPHREAVRRALSVLALPHNAPLAARLVWGTVDAIWYAAGDTATDFNYYSKRGLLAGVYSATVMYWLEDKSEGFADTWKFLDRRLAEVLRLPQALGRLREGLGRFARFPRPGRPFAARR